MEGETPPVADPRRGTISKFLRVLAIVFASVVALATVVELRKVGAPGVPAAWAYVSIAVALVAVSVQVPPVFYRLPRWGRVCATLMPFVALIAFGVAAQQMEPAWSKTAEGAKEAAEREAQQKRDAVANAEQAKRDAETATAQQVVEKRETDKRSAEDAVKAVEACFSTFGHRLPALETQVRESLENPRSFEHVGTVATAPDYYGHNVEMTLRAENGFGAVRTGTVKAKINPADCTIQEVGSITD